MYVGSVTIPNNTNIAMPTVSIVTGRSGVQGSFDATGISQTLLVYVNGSPLTWYGWTPLSEDAKSGAFSYTIPAYSSCTFAIYASLAGTLSTVPSYGLSLQITTFGLKN